MADRIKVIKDNIQNAMLVGMSYEDALVLVGASVEEIEALGRDEMFQKECKSYEKTLEKQLLNSLMDAIAIQTEKGKDHGVTWLLGKLNPRYRGEEDKNANAGTIVINTRNVDINDKDNAVEIDEV